MPRLTFLTSSLPSLIYLLIIFSLIYYPLSLHAQPIPSNFTYDNDALGITLNYPNDWILAREMGNKIDLVHPSPEYQFGSTILSISVSFSNISQQQFENIKFQNMQQFFDFISKIYPNFNSTLPQYDKNIDVLTSNTEEINGLSSIIFEFQNNNQFSKAMKYLIIFILSKNSIYEINFFSPLDSYNKHLPSIKEIINSLKLNGISKENLISNYISYSNILREFKFQYPAIWHIQEMPTAVAIGIPDKIGSNKIIGQVVISISPNPPGLTIEKLPLFKDEYLDRTLTKEQKEVIYVTPGSEEVNLKGQIWHKFQYQYPDNTNKKDINGDVVMTIKDNKVYFINYSAFSQQFYKFEPQVQQIINSFSFIENPFIKK